MLVKRQETNLCSELESRLFVNVLLVCDVLYNLVRSHQLLCFSVRDLKAYRKNKLKCVFLFKDEAKYISQLAVDTQYEEG